MSLKLIDFLMFLLLPRFPRICNIYPKSIHLFNKNKAKVPWTSYMYAIKQTCMQCNNQPTFSILSNKFQHLRSHNVKMPSFNIFLGDWIHIEVVNFINKFCRFVMRIDKVLCDIDARHAYDPSHSILDSIEIKMYVKFCKKKDRLITYCHRNSVCWYNFALIKFIKVDIFKNNTAKQNKALIWTILTNPLVVLFQTRKKVR